MDIIARTTLNVELHTQTSPSLPIQLFGELADIYALLEGPINRHSFNPYIQWRRWKASKDLDRWLHSQIRSHFETMEQKGAAKDIIDLAIQEFGTSLSIEEYSDAAKSFLFAGHETTSTMLSWLYWLLTQHPEAMAKMREEHERVFGPNGGDAEDIIHQLLEKPSKLSELKYNLQCMKETLRLYPPAATARMSMDEK
jgi:cytochrome P450